MTRLTGRLLVFASIASAIAVLGLGVMTVYEIRDSATEVDEACDERVDTRADARLMWQRVIDRFPTPEIESLQRDLDELLPDLVCVDGVAVPADEVTLASEPPDEEEP